MKPWTLAQVTLENKIFIHKNLGSFFLEDGAEQIFIFAQGKKWTGDTTFDEFT